MNKTGNSDSSELRLLTTATLIRRYHERCPLSELYDKATRSYETLFDTLEKTETAGEISALLNIPAVTVKVYAEAIINLLLFNKENDPYLSFGLESNAPMPEVKRRWKNLIVLYHPDKYLDQKMFEERAKKINQVYEEIQAMQRRQPYSESLNNVSPISPAGNDQAFPVRYFKNIPYIIIALAVLTAIFFLLLFFFDLRSARFSPLSQEVKRKELALIRTDRVNDSRILMARAVGTPTHATPV